MSERKLRNSELALQKREEEEAAAAEDAAKGICEIFEKAEDEPLSRADDGE